MNPQPTIDTVLAAMRRLEVGDVRDRLHALQEAQDCGQGDVVGRAAGLQGLRD
jgi:hypothetical protein